MREVEVSSKDFNGSISSICSMITCSICPVELLSTELDCTDKLNEYVKKNGLIIKIKPEEE